jgi:hypothetical protein
MKRRFAERHFVFHLYPQNHYNFKETNSLSNA